MLLTTIIRKKIKSTISIIKLKWLTRDKTNLLINLGSAGISTNDWIPTDIDSLDITQTKDWERYFTNESITGLFSEHVIEHLTYEECKLAMANCFRFLKYHGRLRIAVPDGFHPDKEYIDMVKPGGTGSGSDDHKILYNYKILEDLLKSVGFEVELLEYFDERGQFHFSEWSPENGLVQRSSRFDKRNKQSPLKYTSLIIDAIKKEQI